MHKKNNLCNLVIASVIAFYESNLLLGNFKVKLYNNELCILDAGFSLSNVEFGLYYKEILKHLEITSKLLSKVETELFRTQKESIIYAMPDLGIAQNGTRMLWGFYTGDCYFWNSDVPFIPVDATVNVCGTTVYRLKHKISVQEFKKD